MNKRGIGPVGAMALFGVFLLVWFMVLGGWINNVGQQAISDNSLTGVEAFFFANLNFVILICMLIGMIAWSYFGSG